MCILCDNWEATPYSKRPTTDISTNTGHELLLLGYYLGNLNVAADTLPQLCPEHEGILNQIADFKERQAAAIAAAAAQAPQPDAVTMQNQYKQRIAKLNAPPPAPPKPVPKQFTAQALISQAAAAIAQAEGAPPVEPSVLIPGQPVPADFKFECPVCKKMVTNGEIHDCVFQP